MGAGGEAEGMVRPSSHGHRSAPVEVEHLPPQWRPTPVKPSLPIGVAILSVLIALSGLFILLAGILFLVNLYAGPVVPSDLLLLKSIDQIGAGILIVLGAVLLSVANALWNQERWALYATVLVLFLGLTYLFFTGYITVLFLLLLLVFVYLLTVRRHFY
jgi:hypothetical protein